MGYAEVVATLSLVTAVIGTGINAYWNKKNWDRGRVKDFDFTLTYDPTGLERNLFILRNTGSEPVSGIRLEPSDPVPEAVLKEVQFMGDWDQKIRFLSGEDVSLKPGESAVVQMGARGYHPQENSRRWFLHRKIALSARELSDPIVIEPDLSGAQKL